MLTKKLSSHHCKQTGILHLKLPIQYLKFVKRQRTTIRNYFDHLWEMKALYLSDFFLLFFFVCFKKLFPSAVTTDTLWRKEERPHYHPNSSLDIHHSILEFLTSLSQEELNVRNSASALHHEKVHTYFHSRVVIYFKTRIYCVIV